MEVNILRVSDGTIVSGNIKDKGDYTLPSFTDGWYFDFNKHSKRMKNAQTYVLVCNVEPTSIQGCLIIQVTKNADPYMAYIETAPHNQGKFKKYDFVAGCLISFACRLSHIYADGFYKGYLTFKVAEQDLKKQIRLMAHYSNRYYAQRIGDSNNMFIEPKHGQILIEEYLKITI